MLLWGLNHCSCWRPQERCLARTSRFPGKAFALESVAAGGQAQLWLCGDLWFRYNMYSKIIQDQSTKHIKMTVIIDSHFNHFLSSDFCIFLHTISGTAFSWFTMTRAELWDGSADACRRWGRWMVHMKTRYQGGQVVGNGNPCKMMENLLDGGIL